MCGLKCRIESRAVSWNGLFKIFFTFTSQPSLLLRSSLTMYYVTFCLFVCLETLLWGCDLNWWNAWMRLTRLHLKVDCVYFWLYTWTIHWSCASTLVALIFCFWWLLIFSLHLSHNLGISLASLSHSVSPYACSVNEYSVIPQPPSLAAIGVIRVVDSCIWRRGSMSQSPEEKQH